MIEDLSIELMKMRDKVLSQLKEKNREIEALKQDLSDILKMQKRHDQTRNNDVKRVIVETDDDSFIPIVQTMTTRDAVRKLFSDNPNKYYGADEIADFLREMNEKGVITIHANSKTAAYNTLQKLGAQGFIERKIENNKTKYKKNSN